MNKFWRWLPEPTSSRTSFLLEDKVRTGTTTLTSAWLVKHIQICRRARPLVNRNKWDRLSVQEEYSQLLASYTELRHREWPFCSSIRPQWRLVARPADCSLRSSSRQRSYEICRGFEAWLHALRFTHLSMWCHYRHSRHSRFFLQTKLQQKTTSQLQE